MSTKRDDDSHYGSFSDSEDDIEVEEAAEDMGGYQPGMYYPICLGEVLVERFRVEHKISHSGFSTVWMAYDIYAKTNVALKIMMSGPAAENEYRIQQEISRTVQDTSNMGQCLGTFSL